MSDADKLAEMGTDAEKWATEFCRISQGSEDSFDFIRGWFANAIEAGRSAGQGDPWQDPRAQEFVEDVLSGMAPKLAGSAMVMTLVPDNREGDVNWWVELGASIAMNKPILAVAWGDDEINEKLRAVADEIVVLPAGADPAASKELSDALGRLSERLP